MTVERLIARTVHVAPLEQRYLDLGVAEFTCDVHGAYRVARASLAMGAPSGCYWCRAEVRHE